MLVCAIASNEAKVMSNLNENYKTISNYFYVLQFENHDNHNKLLPNDLYECCGI
jgi:hypothetical protein